MYVGDELGYLAVLHGLVRLDGALDVMLEEDREVEEMIAMVRLRVRIYEHAGIEVGVEVRL
jgi:hypothetical protein